MNTFTKIAFIVAAVTVIFGLGIRATTPDGDKDSHAFMILKLLIVAVPTGVAFSSVGTILACRRKQGRLPATAALLLFLLPVVGYVALVKGWV